MRAWRVRRLGAPEQALALEQTPPPEPLPGFARLRVAAAALGLPDVRMCHGNYQGMRPELPFTPGLEAMGVVEAAAPGLEHWVGRRAAGVTLPPHGGLAEQALALGSTLVDIPGSLEDVPGAAILIAFQTAHQSLRRRGRLRAGETLLVHGGAGGVGSAAIQVGVALGARVLATARGPEKVRFCRELGAWLAIDHGAEDFVERVREATGGRGADVIYDPVGGEMGERSLRCVAQEGRLLVVGFAAGERPIPPLPLALGNFSVVGCIASGYPPEVARTVWEAAHREVLDWIEQGRVRPVVGRVVRLEEVPAALAELEARRTLGRTVVRLRPRGNPGNGG